MTTATTGSQTKVFTREIEGQTFEIGAGRLAQNAAGSVTIRYGDTVLLVTVCEGDPRPGIDFFPLTVDFEERMYAIGKVPGSFFRREGRPGTDATLAARMTDRPIRPLFPKGFKREVQISCLLIASDRQNPAEPLATVGASAAISMSSLPFEQPVSSVAVGRVNGKLKAFPTYEEQEQSDLELTVAATDDSIVMLEVGAKEVSEADLISAIEYGEKVCRELNALQREVVAALGKPKIEWVAPNADAELALRERVKKILAGREEELMGALKGEGFRGIDEIGKQVTEQISKEDGAPANGGQVRAAAEYVLKQTLRKRILEQGLRADNRKSDEIRKLTAEVGVLPRVHGSGLFQRGETQVLTVATLGALRDRAKLDNIAPTEWKMFMHHYNFPSFSVGEARPLRGPGRREIGHGMLAEKAIEPVLPPFHEFPYTIRLVSDVLSSNGSTSQASVCGSTLALMDAGVPIAAPVAGIAMGLITSDDESKYVLLTDIAGVEDALGDMDFKVAGTHEGVTAVQLDIKLGHLPPNFLQEVFEAARVARMKILEVMLAAIPEPRKEVGEFAPKITIVKIDPSKIGAVIGPGGRVINGIIAATGASIDIEEDGSVFVGGSDINGVRAAIRQIEGLTRELQIGDVFEGPVSRIMSFGAFVEILPGKDGMVHISELSDERVDRVEDVVQVGDHVKVKVMEIDNLGRINLTMRGVDDEGSVGLSDDDASRGGEPRVVSRGGGGGGGRGGPRPGGGGGGRGGDRGPRRDDRGGPPRNGGNGGGDRGPRAMGDRPASDRPAGDRPADGGDRPAGGSGGGRRW